MRLPHRRILVSATFAATLALITPVLGQATAGARQPQETWAATTQPQKTWARETPAVGTAADDYRGTAALSNCSASVVRWPRSVARDKALLLTNGHCHGSRYLRAREVLVRQDYSRAVTLLRRDGTARATVRTSRLVYATMFKTDVALYRLRQTYGQLERSYRVPALTVARRPASGDTALTIPSGYWRQTYRCSLNGVAFRVHESVWDWRRSLRYSDGGCRIIAGTSGSPVLDPRRRVVGVNNTRNIDGERCTLNNPCEESRRGRITVHQGRGYGQQTWWLTTCVGPHRQLNLNTPGCLLPRPR